MLRLQLQLKFWMASWQIDLQISKQIPPLPKHTSTSKASASFNKDFMDMEVLRAILGMAFCCCDFYRILPWQISMNSPFGTVLFFYFFQESNKQIQVIDGIFVEQELSLTGPWFWGISCFVEDFLWGVLIS